MNNKLINYLSGYLTPQRLELYDKVLNRRTRHLTVVLEDIYQKQNASAVLRTCDCFGIQDVHIIEDRNEFQVNREIAMGASKWLSLHKYNNKENNALDAIQTLKKQGYRIVATTPHNNDLGLQDFDIAKGKTALVFGSELPGITETIMQEADEFLKIPMYGFTESFNISVSAAIILHHLTMKMRDSKDLHWQLSNDEKDELKMEWIRKTIKRSELIEKRFWEENKKK
ncbi:tRNA (guanosine-2'-O-)-methyltransferase [Draconibacterium orientale]|uniref:tRNA (guanosine(18)-2'-O)-methyltransferase n=1 Tax=Draconibacterium orientale TaxID=1168034 RepID=X5DE54_9BACT|nr:RNA methyltransferase [Draconibacterium orientale]AHW58657.1 rRNA methyltransferase [Draconibacterium orientale]SET13138.1 tRNA (guanosine-2'-O-)-methyltransferase [Draconibacterium orientale]